jgi:hypothetical protein
MSTRTYIGGCHCGRIRYSVKADLEGQRNGICNCTSCTMKGFIHHHVEKGAFDLQTGFADLQLYKFGSLSAEHYFCKVCGVESFYRSRSDPEMWDINVRCLKDPETGEKVDIYALHYELGDGEHWVESQAIRRKRAHEEKVKGSKHASRKWRLIAPSDAIDSKLDVTAEFRKTWT